MSSLVHRTLIGCVGGLAGAMAMNLFASAATAVGSGDRDGHGVQPPQAVDRGNDATEREFAGTPRREGERG